MIEMCEFHELFLLILDVTNSFSSNDLDLSGPLAESTPVTSPNCTTSGSILSSHTNSVIDPFYDLHPKLKWRLANFVECLPSHFISSGVTLPNKTTPLTIFQEYFLTRTFLNNIAFESNMYASQIGQETSFTITPAHIKKYIGILIYHSIVHVSNMRHYWSPFVGAEPIRQCMNLNEFEKIRRYLHFNNNNDHIADPAHPNYDRLYKIRPVLKHFNERFGTVSYDEKLSIDENICATKAKNSYRQYNPKKPHKWGYKLYMICNTEGFVYQTEIYSGQENQARFRQPGEPDLGSCANVVIRLTRNIPTFHNHKIFFDNYYTTIPLVVFLKKERGILSLGTLRKDRSGRCILFQTNKLKKKVKRLKITRGTSFESITVFKKTLVTVTQWMDNKDVVLASTYAGRFPEDTAQRWSKAERKHIDVARPKCISEYNQFMGGVDLLGSHIGRNRIRMKSRKYYMRMFHHLVDTAIVNCWLLFKRKNPTLKITLAEFRKELAYTLLNTDRKIWSGRGRPPIQKPSKVVRRIIPPLDLRQEGNHIAHFSATRGRCKYADCKGFTFIECVLCKINLCINSRNNCFFNFHFPYPS